MTEKKETTPLPMNAFELISLSDGLNLSGLFEKQQVRLLSQCTRLRCMLTVSQLFFISSIAVGVFTSFQHAIGCEARNKVHIEETSTRNYHQD